MAVAEKFGVLPDDVEARCSEYWLNQIAVSMEGHALDDERRFKKK